MSYHKNIRLKTGEIVSCVFETVLENNSIPSSKTIRVSDPAILTSFKYIDAEGDLSILSSLTPLLPGSKNRIFELPTDSILIIGDMDENSFDRHMNFVEDFIMLYSEITLDKVDECQNTLNESYKSKLH